MARGANSHTWVKTAKQEGEVESAVCSKCGLKTHIVMGPGKRRANVKIAEFLIDCKWSSPVRRPTCISKLDTKIAELENDVE